MSQQQPRKITKRMVDALRTNGKPGLTWDRDLPGFGVRVYSTGRIAYVVQSRGPSGSRRATLGPHGEVTPEEARRLAARVIDRIKAGKEPLEKKPKPKIEHTVAELAEKCLVEYVDRQCKPTTAIRYRLLLKNQIIPSLGEMPVRAVGREHVAALHHDLRNTQDTANHVFWMLSRMFGLAETWGWRPKGTNPCRSIRAYKSNHRERFLSQKEYRRIGRVLKEVEAKGLVHAPAIAAIRMLMLTGCRSGEIAGLRWDDVDRSSEHLRLKDSKTGPRWIPLTREALIVLDSQKKVPGNPWVFAGIREGTPVGDLTRFWIRLRKRMGLEDVRLHDLRHSYASRALFLGESLSMIGRLLGHSSIDTTARYAHLARDTEKASAARVAGSIEANILPESGELSKNAEHPVFDRKRDIAA